MISIILKNNPVLAEIYNLITAIVPYDKIEKEHMTDTLSWVKSGAPIFRIQKPDVPNKHLVSYFMLFDETSEKVLLVDHKKAQLWLPSGGHVEVNEHPIETVSRECLEELGVQADFWIQDPLFLSSTLTVGLTAGHTDVSLWYVLKGNSQKSYQFDEEEFNTICLFGLDEIPYENADPHMRRFVGKLKANLF